MCNISKSYSTVHGRAQPVWRAPVHIRLCTSGRALPCDHGAPLLCYPPYVHLIKLVSLSSNKLHFKLGSAFFLHMIQLCVIQIHCKFFTFLLTKQLTLNKGAKESNTAIGAPDLPGGPNDVYPYYFSWLSRHSAIRIRRSGPLCSSDVLIVMLSL